MNLARTVDAIYLRPTSNLKGGQKLMDLATGRLIKQPKVYTCVMTKFFIKAVEKLSESQEFKTLKKFNCKKMGNIFPDADLLAGMDWVHNDNETYEIQEDENK